MLDPLGDPKSATTSSEDVDADLDLDKRRKARDYNEENWFYWLRIVGAIVVTALTFALVIIYLWHLVAPTEWRWVPVDDLEKLERLSATVLAGVMATLFVSYVFRRWTRACPNISCPARRRAKGIIANSRATWQRTTTPCQQAQVSTRRPLKVVFTRHTVLGPRKSWRLGGLSNSCS